MSSFFTRLICVFPFLFCLIIAHFQLSAQPGSLQPLIRLDQFGYLEDMEKVAVISNPQVGFNSAESFTPSATLQVRLASDNSLAFSGPATAWNGGATHTQSGDQVWWFDFSALTTPGEYYIYDPVQDVHSHSFEIAEDVYKEVLKHATRVFFYQRSGFAKTTPYVPSYWGDGASHLHAEQDLDCRLVTDPTNVATSRDLSGGWYDAGDYNKYVNFTYPVMHDLLGAYETNPVIWTDDFNIPESGNGIPDLLDEVKWELDWLLKMQLSDGSCLMKVSVTNFNAASPPSADMNPRRYGSAEASATRTICSIFAHAAIVYKSLGVPAMDVYGDTLLARAELAWSWIVSNPGTSSYGNTGFSSANPEVSAYQQQATRLSAAIYLYAATGNTAYRNYVDANYTSAQPMQWTYWYPYESAVQDALLYYTQTSGATASVSNAITNNCINSTSSNNAAMLPAYLNETDAYRSHMNDAEFGWGSNREKAHSGIILTNMLSYNLDPGNAANYRNAAAGFVHYLHGTNALGMAMLTHMDTAGAEVSANEMYHAWFGDGTNFDNAQTSLYGPPPGYLTGGPNRNFSATAGTISPPNGQPVQKSYKDWNTSWPEDSWQITEPAIYYQAAYVKLLAQFTNNSTEPLKVEYGNFDARALNQSVKLDWTTFSERGTDHFLIQRATSGQHFETIGTEIARGNTDEATSYTFFDQHPPEGRLLYRLVEIETNGQQSFSEIKEVVFQLKPFFTIHPNPADGNLFVQLLLPESDYELRILNMQGQILLEKDLPQGTQKLELSINHIVSGLYLVEVRNADQFWHQRLVVK